MADMFPIRNGLKQGDALTPMLFNFALEYAIRRVQVNQDGLKLNGTHQLVAYADDVNILGGSIHSLKENADRNEHYPYSYSLLNEHYPYACNLICTGRTAHRGSRGIVVLYRH